MTLSSSRYTISFALILAVLCLLSAPSRLALKAQTPAAKTEAASPILYEVRYDVKPGADAAPSLLHVAITIDVTTSSRKMTAGGEANTVTLQMPVWCPGDYHVQNFGKYVQNLRASDALVARDQRVLPVAHPDASTWTIATQGIGRMRVEYDLPQIPRGYFSENVFLQPRYAFVNGASALLYVVGRKNQPVRLEAQPPSGWRVEMPLPPRREPSPAPRESKPGKELPAALQKETQNGATVPPNVAPNTPEANESGFDAPDYDTLADSPLIMAAPDAIQTYDLRLDNAAPTIYRPVYFGSALPPPANRDALNKMLLQIARAETRIMGGAPNTLYEFLLEGNGRGGGLEHLNACRLPLWAGTSPQGFAPFAAHEFFHQWNIKRIRPRVLGPFDYVHPPRTHNLWFAEGVTDYYAQVAVRRAGIWSEERFLAYWQRAISRMQRNPSRLQVTADESSWKVWEGGDSEGFGGLSYYAKGALIGLCLDLKIRHVTQNRRSLDDVMRALYKQCAFPNPGYDEDGLRDTINRVAEQDLTDFYNLLARSTQEMPFAECLGYAGLDEDLNSLPNATPEQITLRKQWTAQTEGI